MRKSVLKNIQESQQKLITSTQQMPLSTIQKMEISQILTNILSRLSYAYPQIQSALLANIKNITPAMYWFLIDAYNYPWDITVQYKSILNYRIPNLALSNHRTMKNSNHGKSVFQQEQSKDIIEEKLQFINELKTWIAQFKGTINLEDIQETVIDQVIEIAEGNLQVFSYSVDEQLNQIVQKAQQQFQRQQQFFKRYGIQRKIVHNMFIYDQIEDDMCSTWFKKFNKIDDAPKCYICSQRDYLIQCKTCSLKIHEKCYPTLMKKNKKRLGLNKEQIGQNFQCENCRLSIDFNNQVCQLCCCSGGYFVQAESSNTMGQEVVISDPSQTNIPGTKLSSHLEFKVIKKEEKQPKYLHLTCYIWNTECQWNEVTNEAQFQGKIDRKKLSSICSFCGISYGSSIPCNNETCRRSYHPQCAKICNIQMNFIRAKTSVVQLFCERHRHLRNYQAIEQSHENRFRQCRKLFQFIDKQIKRNSFVPEEPSLKIYWQKDQCTVCRATEIYSSIEICHKCRKWYHLKCSTYCKRCS